MARTVEIILKASDQFSDATKKLQLQMAAAKIATDELNKSVEKLQQKHPGLSLDEAQAAAKALQDAKRGSDEAGKSFANANIAARGLGQEFGIVLPRAVTAFLAQSKLVGPALSAAFSAVAVVGLIEVLGQIPKLYDKIIEGLTGWDQKAKETYQHQLDYNQKLIEQIDAFKAKAAEAAVTSYDPLAPRRAAIREEIADVTIRLIRQQSALSVAQNALEQMVPGDDPLARRAAQLGELTGSVGPGGRTYSEIKKDAEDAKTAADDLALKLYGLKESLKVVGIEADTTAKRLSEEIARQLSVGGIGHMPLRGGFGFVGPLNQAANPLVVPFIDPITGEVLTPQTRPSGLPGQQVFDVLENQKQEFQREVNRSLMRADSLPLETFKTAIPIRPLVVPQYFESGAVHFPQMTPAGTIDPFAQMKFEEMKRFQDQFIETFGKATGQVWDTFFEQGSDVLTRLANVAKGWIKDIGKMVVENLATGLLFGSTKKSFGTELLGIDSGPFGLGGGLFGGLLRKIGGNNGPWSEMIPGAGGNFGVLGGVGGLLGGLLTKNPVSGTLAKGAIGIINPATGEIVGGAAAGAAGGLTGALGLGGGAGLLGLGAATIPVIGGIAAGAALIAMEIFGHHHDAPFTRDPNAIQNTREYLFYTGATALADAAKDISNFTHKLNTLPTGALVKEGLPVALGSSNQFRRDVAATLNGDM